MRFFCFLSLILIATISFGQTVSLQKSTTVKADRFVGVDNYKNTYFIKDQVLHKTGEEGNFIFNDFQLGRINSVDIINPLKVVVFFQDTNTVVLLDNKLNEIQRINFNTLPQFMNVSTATNAGSNRLWVFNVGTQQLELFNYRSVVQTTVSQPIKGKLLSQASSFNYCFVLTEEKLYAYNVYGSILNEVSSEGYQRIVQQNENLMALKENTLYYFPNFARREGELPEKPKALELPEMKIKDFQLTDNSLYIYDGKNLHTFTITFPKKK